MTKALAPFQAEDMAWMLKSTHNKNMLLYDRGLGKTVVATMRNITADVGTHYVICPSNAIRTWRDHALSWYSEFHPELDVDVHILRGSPHERRKLYDELLVPERQNQRRLFITTYSSFIRDSKNILTSKHISNIDQIDVDEAHKMRSRKSANFNNIKATFRQRPFISFLTGTPISRGAQEFWTFLNMMDAKYFSSYWRFVDTFCETWEGRWGKEIIAQKNTEAFFHLLSQYSRIRLKTDPEIASQMPPKSRESLYVQMDDCQRQMYDGLDVEGFIFTGDNGLVVASNSMEKVMRLRQLLVCPQILDATATLGSAFNDFLDQLSDMDSSDRHTVLFTPFKRAFAPFTKALQDRGIPVSQLSGGISIEEQEAQIKDWRASKGVMLCTIAYAESFDLEPAKTSYFIGYEWDPNMNVQAEDRLHRWTTTYPVTNYYYRYEGTVDDGLCNTVNWKQRNITYIMDKNLRQQEQCPESDHK
jgi:SNF2 family DNA or RNA helicase